MVIEPGNSETRATARRTNLNTIAFAGVSEGGTRRFNGCRP